MTKFSIYQINVDRDTANVCFIGMESLEKIKGTKEVNAAAYDRVYGLHLPRKHLSEVQC